jgi:uncharacterized protein (DUF305 family)
MNRGHKQTLLIAGVVAGALTLGGLGLAAAQGIPGRAPNVPSGPSHGAMHQQGGHAGMAGMGAQQGMPGAGGGTAMDVGQHFIQEMIPHHDDAVTMADLALQQAEHPELAQLAEDITRVQTAEIEQMRAWYQQWYGTDVPPGTMGSIGHDAQSLDGAQPFDQAFIEQMIPHHEQAVMMATMALRFTDRPELRTLLQSIITSQTAEIEQMRSWYQQWYGTPVPASSGMNGAGMRAGHGGPGMGMATTPAGTSRQTAVAARGAQVMPFDLTRTTHTFTDTATGGREVVTANDPADIQQIELIRAHLQAEAAKFGRGDFSDPAAIHGDDMSGLAQLRVGYSRIAFSYEELPDGAAITYRTDDPVLVSVVHTWFAAQRGDHNAQHGTP